MQIPTKNMLKKWRKKIMKRISGMHRMSVDFPWIGGSDVLHVDSLFEYTDSYFVNKKFVLETR